MKIVDYIKSVNGEMKHVSWPTKKQAILFTVIVMVISLATAAYLGFLDYIFSKILELFV